MQNQAQANPSVINRLLAWGVHLLTAGAAVAGLFTLLMIHQHNYIAAFWLMGVAVFIDAIDGTLARRFHAAVVAPRIDGALLDNMVDYLNYVITPVFFLLINQSLLPDIWRECVASLIVLTSAYQFTQSDAKTKDNFFKGFPCYWNFVVFYLFFFATSQVTNTLVLIVLAILIFVPIKYVYPSRMDHLTKSRSLRKLMMLLSILYGCVSVAMLWLYPQTHHGLVAYAIAYIALYFGFSLYRTFYPLQR